MKTRIKYSKELLENIVKRCFSYQQVMRELGLKLSGGSSTHLKSRCILYNIDTSHFTGLSSNKGKNHKGGTDALSANDILVIDRLGGRRDHSFRIKRAMLEQGIVERCAICNIGPEWNNKKLVLQLDHINGNGLDNRLNNVRFLCPNCHSQTDTFCSKNMNNIILY